MNTCWQTWNILLTYLYIKVGGQDTGWVHSSTSLLLLLRRQHSRSTRYTSTACITCNSCCLVKLRHGTSTWIHCHYMLKMLIDTVQVQMVVLHVVSSLLLLVEMMLWMVWMMWDGMVINVWMVVGMMVMVLHTFWWGWFSSTHNNHIITSAIILVDVFFCWRRLSTSRCSTARKQTGYNQVSRTLLNPNLYATMIPKDKPLTSNPYSHNHFKGPRPSFKMQ